MYGAEGGAKRREGEGALRAAIEKHVGHENPYGESTGIKIFWPPEIGGPLMAGSEEGNGLHNIAATIQKQSPEFADLPVTEMLVPDFDAMTDEQKASFLALLHVEV
mgnify:FL=1